jgi:hypothetical protein
MSNDEAVLRPRAQNVAPLTSARGPISDEVLRNYERMLGMLREIRAEVQNLDQVLEEIIESESIETTTTRAEDILATLRGRQSVYDANANQIGTRLGELRQVLGETSTLYDRYGDEITYIENYWERTTFDWPRQDQVEQEVLRAAQEEVSTNEPASMTPEELRLAVADEVIRRVHRVRGYLNRMVYHAALLTIPGRLNQHLEQVRIGQTLDFNATFKDEVASAEDRRKILEYLNARPNAVQNGIIDVEHAVVYHASPSMARRRQSYIYILLAVVVGGLLSLLVAELGAILDIPDWPIAAGQGIETLVGYGFTMLGGLVHLGVDAVKQARSSARGSFLALEDWFVWVHIHEVGIIVGVVSLWIGFIGLLFLNSPAEPVSWQTSFLVGYSIDSFIDLFLQRFNTVTAARIGTMRF